MATRSPKPQLVAALVLAGIVLTGGAARAEVTINLGTIPIPAGAATHRVEVQVTGGEALTDMVARFQVADGGALFGGSVDGPKLTSIDLAGSIWQGAPGDFAQFSTASYPSQVQELNVSLNTAGESVNANGVLCTLHFDTAGYEGSFDLRMTGTVAGDSTFLNAGAEVTRRLTNGTLVVGEASLVRPSLKVEALANGTVRILIKSEPGLTYDLEWSSDLQPGSWTRVPLGLPGTGLDLEWIDSGAAGRPPPASSPRRFYRAIAN